ncbi:MAG TPA: glycosyl hydrolase family 28-related protein [Tepidisphaeraceae bacterium]|jgi:hypothetical protein|nr:glycosyl hydrolase family 28-related protein [Tepidisphaeraceae bacterium]
MKSLALTVLLAPAAVVAQDKLFPADAVINVTLPPYSATPDDDRDDTDALQRAVSDHVGTGRTLYFPAGVYDISQPLVAKTKDGLWEAHLTLQGQHRDKTILKLTDATPGFTDAANPQAVYSSGNHWQPGDDPAGGGNKAFRNNFFDLTIDTGHGNPGAIGIEWANSNQGTIRDVTVRSGDGTGSSGIAMKRRIPGPGYIKDVTVEGFDAGIDVKDGQYGFTLEDVTVRGQRVAGIRLHDNLLHIRGLMSENAVPAIVATGAISALTATSLRLGGEGDADKATIDASGTTLLRTVALPDTNHSSVLLDGEPIETPSLELLPTPDGRGKASKSRAIFEATQPHQRAPGPRVARTFLIQPEDSPTFWNAVLTDWIAVGPRQDGEPDDTAAIQRAFDSGKSTIYFVNDRIYHLSDTLVIRGNVRQVLGMGAEINLGAAKEPFSDKQNPRPLIRIDETNHPEVFFERMFFNAQYPGEVLFESNTTKTVVIKHSMGWVGNEGLRRTYRNTSRAQGAKVFIEDCFLPGWEFTKQNVWARQLNPENYDGDGTTSQVTNAGGRLWILGFKTEGPAPFITTTAGGATELLGGYNYISATQLPAVPAGAVPYDVQDAVGSFTFVSENFRDNDYDVYIRDAQGDDVVNVSPKDLPPRNGTRGDRSRAVPLYRTRAATRPVSQ